MRQRLLTRIDTALRQLRRARDVRALRRLRGVVEQLRAEVAALEGA